MRGAWVAIAVLFCATSALAADKRLAVLELVDDASLSRFEADALTDDVRGACTGLPDTLVMTRESIMALLPPGTDLSKCSQASCEVEAGRMLGADLVIAGGVGRFAGKLQVRLKLFETERGALLAQATADAASLERLPTEVRRAAAELVSSLRGGAVIGSSPSPPPGADWTPGAATVAVLELQSEPAGAVVLVDGRVACQATPCSKAVERGERQVSMQLAGYGERRERLRVAGNAAVRWELEATFGELDLAVFPPGLGVTVDGAKAEGGVRRLDPGSYAVRVEDPCHAPTSQVATVRRGERTRVEVRGEPRPAGLDVRATDDRGNDVAGVAWVDGARLGDVPGVFKVGVCARELEVRAGDGRAAKQALTLRERETAAVSVKLGAAGGVTAGAAGIEWVRIPSGRFQMGSDSGASDEKPVHPVSMSAFEMARTETTVRQYAACVSAGKCAAPSRGNTCNWDKGGREGHPVNCVTWDEAASFCSWAGGALPTEAQWEYAARGTDGRTWPWGNEEATCARAVMDDGGFGCGEKRTWPAGSKPAGASPFGLQDMAGNVWEWVADWYDSGYYRGSPASDPRGPGSGSGRVERGGGFGGYASLLRASYRGGVFPAFADDALGFRCSRSPVP